MLPYFHGMGFGIPVLAILLAGGTAICPRDFIPSDFSSLLKLCRPTFFIAGPAHHHAILRGMKKVPPPSEKENSLRLILSSAAVMPDTVHQELESVLKVGVIEQYASTETGVISVNLPPKKGSVGIPVIDHLLILDKTGIPAGPLEQGEVLVRGEPLFSGHEDAPEENAAAFTDGWFSTGDLGYLDNDGYLFLTGRKKELINKGGEKIAPEEIDTLLRSHPGVREAMTFPIEDPVLGEDIAAMVVRKQENLTEHEIRRFLLNHITPSKIPRKIYFVAEIPKTASGKPKRYIGTKRYS
jgi:acyl-CoA synthetase (AMP-forming)/AMP-acid ligase II